MLIDRFTYSAALVMLATSVAGCFGSTDPLVEAEDSVMLFGQEGRAVRVLYDQIGGPSQEEVAFVWRNNAYELYRGRLREPAAHRLQKLEGEWYIWEKFEAGQAAAYGLARREGPRLWTYAPVCAQLSAEERRALNLVISKDAAGLCRLSTRAQLVGAMRPLIERQPKLLGYYEVMER